MSDVKTYGELLVQAKADGALQPRITAFTDLIEQAIRQKSYKFTTDIRNDEGEQVIEQMDVLVTFSFSGYPLFWVVMDPSYDGNIMQLARSNIDGTKLIIELYEG